MTKLFTHSFERYSKKFELYISTCHCGGKFSIVNLKNSNRNVLEVHCDKCGDSVSAIRKHPGPAFKGAPLPA